MNNYESIKAYAKINMHLEVLNKRNDGYHEISSIMASIDLHDDIDIDIKSFAKGKNVDISIIISGGKYKEAIVNISPETNLAYKAIDAYCKKTGYGGEFNLKIKKNIPIGAGLGGGSSDAGAILRYLNGKFSLLKEAEVLKIASEIGADVPFCYTGGVAYCTGIGEIIEPINVKLNGSILLANDGTHVNTARAYSMLKIKKNTKNNKKSLDKNMERIIYGLNKSELYSIAGLLHNDFEEPVFSLHIDLELLKLSMLDEGAIFSIMSGSGSTIYGVFNNSEDLNRAKVKLEKDGLMLFESRFI